MSSMHRANDVMCLALDEKGKASIKGEDHAVFTKLTKEYEDRFFKDMQDLNVLDPDELVRVTEYVEGDCRLREEDCRQ